MGGITQETKNHHKLVGMTKTELKTFLGHGFNDPNENIWMYRINESFSILQKNYLYVYFENNRVKYHVVRRFKIKQNHLRTSKLTCTVKNIINKLNE